MGSNVYPASLLQFMLTVLRFLEGAVIKEHNEDLWERTRSSVAATTLDGNRQPPVGVTTNHRAAERIE
jgi:hypothetical protein